MESSLAADFEGLIELEDTTHEHRHRSTREHPSSSVVETEVVDNVFGASYDPSSSFFTQAFQSVTARSDCGRAGNRTGEASQRSSVVVVADPRHSLSIEPSSGGGSTTGEYSNGIPKQSKPKLITSVDGEGKLSVADAWHSLLYFATFAVKCGSLLRVRRSKDPLFVFPPALRLVLRRYLRRKRFRQAKSSISRPTVDEVKKDAVLKLFPDAQLQQLVESMTLRYYFPCENIIVRGLVERECYFISSGSVNVVIGGNKVATLPKGLVLGSQGMVSGEPRTASIVVKEPSFIWRTTKDEFDAGGTNDGAPTRRKEASSLTHDQRCKNFRELYRKLICFDYLKGFSFFHERVPASTTDLIMAAAEPVVLKPQETLNLQRTSYFVTKGRFLIHLKGVTGDRIEAIAHCAESLFGGNNKQLVAEDLAGEDSLEWCGPAWLGLPTIFLRQWFEPLTITTVGYCDAYKVPIELFEKLPAKSADRVFRNCLAIRCRFMPKLTQRQLVQHIFSGKLAFSFATNCFKSMEPRPYTFAPGDRITFDKLEKDYFLVVVAGALLDQSSNERLQVSSCGPFVWPEVHLMHFGGTFKAETLARTEVYAVSRGNYLNSLITDLQYGEQETIVQVLTALYSTRCGKKPMFDEGTLHPPEKADSREGERYRAFLELHQLYSRGTQPIHIVQSLKVLQNTGSGESGGGGSGGGAAATATLPPAMDSMFNTGGGASVTSSSSRVPGGASSRSNSDVGSLLGSSQHGSIRTASPAAGISSHHTQSHRSSDLSSSLGPRSPQARPPSRSPVNRAPRASPR